MIADSRCPQHYGNAESRNKSIDPIRVRLLTLRFLPQLDSPGVPSDSSAMLTMLVITGCIAVGTVVHHRRHKRCRW
jgi:hypothetical protein